MTTSLKQEDILELLYFKLNKINETIAEILKKWNYNNTDDFLNDTKVGKLDEGVMDAIMIKQLLLELNKYQTILLEIKENED
jgi:hypothetical protein